MSEFTGFPPEGLTFLTELGGRDRDWFQEHRDVYDEHVVGPAKAFVDALGATLREQISPTIDFAAKTNGSIAPINNDVRFAKDAPPYKDHLLIKFWDGSNKKTAPTLWVRISESDVGFATGAAITDLDLWRTRVADESTGTQLATALAALGKGRSLDVAGEGLKRVPSPYDADHPRADLLRHKAFQARWSEPTPKKITSRSFVDWCALRLTRCTHVHRWLAANL